MASVALRTVSKRFGDIVALDHLDLDIDDGESFAIVGASGCGKSTALRIVAGLEQPTEGIVLLDDVDVTALPARERRVGIVSQRDTLLEHRTGRRNIRFPLEVRPEAAPPGTADDLVDVQARELAIERLLDRKPAELSRGERRAVQLARALVARPTVLLLDEPLAFMDPDLRRRMRTDIVEIQGRHRVTTVLVTADHDDATVMAGRIAVLDAGRLHQVGAPRELVDRPATTTVAAFFGEPPMNLVPAPVRLGDGERRVKVLGNDIRAWSPLLDDYAGKQVTVGIRPTDLVPATTQRHTFEAVVEAVAPHGHHTDVRVSVPGEGRLDVTVDAPGPRRGEMLRLGLLPDRFHWFDPFTGMALLHPTG